MREKNIYLEDRSLEIVDKTNPIDALRRVRNLLQLVRIAPSLVSPGSRNSEIRFEQQESKFFCEGNRMDAFGSSTTDGNALKDKKWHIRADFAAKLGQLVASK